MFFKHDAIINIISMRLVEQKKKRIRCVHPYNTMASPSEQQYFMNNKANLRFKENISVHHPPSIMCYFSPHSFTKINKIK